MKVKRFRQEYAEGPRGFGYAVLAALALGWLIGVLLVAMMGV